MRGAIGGGRVEEDEKVSEGHCRKGLSGGRCRVSRVRGKGLGWSARYKRGRDEVNDTCYTDIR